MDVIDQALAGVGAALAALLGLVLAVFGGIEQWLRHQLQVAGAPHDVQTVILVLAGVVIVIAALRLLGGIVRLLIIAFLILLLLHVALPGSRL